MTNTIDENKDMDVREFWFNSGLNRALEDTINEDTGKNEKKVPLTREFTGEENRAMTLYLRGSRNDKVVKVLAKAYNKSMPEMEFKKIYDSLKNYKGEIK